MSELRNSWEIQQNPTMNDLARPSQYMPSTNTASLSRFSSQIHPQYGINERQVQVYQQPRQQSWTPQKPQMNTNSGKETSKWQSFKNFISSKLVVGILIGVIICGIPMAVMTSLYVQAKSSSTNSTSSSGSSGTTNTSSTSLPSQCSSYTSLSDVYRLYTSTSCCYTADCSLTAAWYRITGVSGTQLLTTPISTGYCGASYPAWFNGSYPSTAGTTITGVVCANVGGTICPTSYSTTVSVTNCNGFYVFYLVPFSICSVRYCTM